MNQRESRKCQNCRQEFWIEPEDFTFYERINVPPPTWCPECRMIRRMSFRNERTLYRRECNLCKKNIIAMYDSTAPFSVFCYECWWSDKWGAETFEQDYDWNRPFLEQFRELLLKVPKIALVHYPPNTDVNYANFVAKDRNVYLAYSVVECENVFYSYSVDKSKESFDCLYLKGSEFCFENTDSENNYNCSYLFRSRDCINSSFLFDCANCQNCFMSSNLRNKQFVFRGQQLNKNSYEAKLQEVIAGSYESYEEYRTEFKNLMRSSLHKFANLVKTTNCTGDNIANSKNVRGSFGVYNAENVKYSIRALREVKDTYDLYGGLGELLYEGTVTGWGSFKLSVFTYASASHDASYIDWCQNCSYLLGCAGLRNKQYCILNKQYSKEEYEALVPKVIEHMNAMPYVDMQGRVYRYGEFFPPDLSPFAYNETIAQEYFSLTKDQAFVRGCRWRDPDGRDYHITKTFYELPDHVKDAADSIVNEVIGCAHEGKCNEQCTTAFKIIPQELAFYRKMNLPLPRLCPNCRHYERLAQRNPLKLWHRTCMCDYKVRENGGTHQHHPTGPCPNEFETSYVPDRLEVVYCEPCYNAEVV
ncbi:hypothetical protein HY967_04545 [Candidatus Jorgensenbacteria bacterium]|nr:hypothetical protein [Candidatus Jorgensenbacteria bacterium]